MALASHHVPLLTDRGPSHLMNRHWRPTQRRWRVITHPHSPTPFPRVQRNGLPTDRDGHHQTVSGSVTLRTCAHRETLTTQRKRRVWCQGGRMVWQGNSSTTSPHLRNRTSIKHNHNPALWVSPVRRHRGFRNNPLAYPTNRRTSKR